MRVYLAQPEESLGAKLEFSLAKVIRNNCLQSKGLSSHAAQISSVNRYLTTTESSKVKKQKWGLQSTTNFDLYSKLKVFKNDSAHLFVDYYNNRQWPTVVNSVLDMPKCFDTRKKSLETRSEAEYF